MWERDDREGGTVSALGATGWTVNMVKSRVLCYVTFTTIEKHLTKRNQCKKCL